MKITTLVIILLAILSLDSIWLTLRSEYHNSLFFSIQKSPLTLNVIAGALVYIILALALFYGAVKDAKTVRDAAMNGALVGLVLYGFYDATNMATLRGWTWYMFFTDIAWGTFASAAAAGVAAYLTI
jgi:uncharacterized membrane protein